MNLINDDTPKSQLFLLMWLLENGQLKFDLQLQLDDPMFKGFIAISNSLGEIFEDDVDIYWISKGFYNNIKNFSNSKNKLVEASKSLLEKEDKILHKHLTDIAAFGVVPIERWFTCLFAGVLHETALVKIWDKVVGKS